MTGITPDTTVEEIIEKHPKTVGVFIQFSIPCLVCGEPFWGTIAELCRRHSADLESLLERLNGMVKNAA